MGVSRRRLRGPRSARGWGGAVVLLIVVVAGYYVWLGLQVKHDLGSAQTHASRLEKALSSGDEAKAARELDSYTSAVSSARARTQGLGWKVLRHVPVIGKDAQAATTIANVGVDVGHDALTPLVEEAEGGLVGQLPPRDGHVDVAAVRRLGPLSTRVAGSIASATKRLHAVDVAGLLGFVRHPFESALDKLESASRAADSAARAVRLVPSMLGADGPRTYLLLFDNNAEIRSTGGIAGAYGVLRADPGRLSLVRQGSASDFGESKEPVLALTRAERGIYGAQVGTYFQDTNMTPDFPRTAGLARAMFAKEYGQQVDGVMSVDTVTLGYLLKATGPVTVDGVRLTSDNAADQLLHDTYVRIRKPKQQNVFFAHVARTVFNKVSAGAGSPIALARALARSVREGRMYLHSFDATEQQQLDGTEIAGALDYSVAAPPQVGVYFDDGTGAKMSYFLRPKTSVTSSCSGGREQISGRVTLSELTLPTSGMTSYVTGGGRYGVPVGQQLVNVRVYGPAGSRFGTISIDGKKVDADVVTDQGRPVATVAAMVGDKEPVEVTWAASLPARSGARVEVASSPTMTGSRAHWTVPTGCGG